MDNNCPRDTFIQNIQIIKLQSTCNVTDSRSIQSAIHFFRKLKVIDISWIAHSAKQAATVLKIVPENLTLLVRREDGEAFEQNAICVQRNIVIELCDIDMRASDIQVPVKSLKNSIRKRSREGDEDSIQEDKDEEKIEEEEKDNDSDSEDQPSEDLGHGRKRQRTPSFVREIIAMELVKIEEMKKRLYEAYFNHLEVPHILREVFQISDQHKFTKPVDIGNCIDEIADKLIHAIVTTKESNWVFNTWHLTLSKLLDDTLPEKSPFMSFRTTARLFTPK